MSRCRSFCHFTKYNVATLQGQCHKIFNPFLFGQKLDLFKARPGGGGDCVGDMRRGKSRESMERVASILQYVRVRR